MNRSRYGGTAEELADLLDSTVAPMGRSWCRYPEEGGVHVEAITNSHALLAALHTAAPNLSFTRKTLEATARLL
eukprot:8091755-Alexandrium_andersonii.AAC.1